MTAAEGIRLAALRCGLAVRRRAPGRAGPVAHYILHYPGDDLALFEGPGGDVRVYLAGYAAALKREEGTP